MSNRDLISTGFYEAEVFVREAEDGGHALFGVLVPWDVAVPVDSSGKWATPTGVAVEMFQRGALDKTIAEAKNGIPMYGGRHVKSSLTSEEPAGFLLRSENTPDGQTIEVKLFDTSEGHKARQMAEAKIWTGFSMGAASIRTDSTRQLAGRKLFLRQEIALDHIAFVRNPAYVDARLLAMRDELEAIDPDAARRARARMRRLAASLG